MPSVADRRPTMYASDAALRQILNSDPDNRIPLEVIAESLGMTMDRLRVSMRRLILRIPAPGDMYRIIADE